MRLAIIIVTYEGEQYIGPLFASLVNTTPLTDIGIIVVENASCDGTLQAVRRATQNWPSVEILAQTRNTGFAEGNNIGLQRAREQGAPFALLLNQDLELTEGWLEPLERVMAERPDVAAAQPLILLHAQPERVNSAGNELHFCGFGYCGAYNRPLATLRIQSEPRSVAFASGAALLLRMEALNRAGDFDQRLFLYHEDTDLQVRLRQLGYDCVVVPDSRVFHKYTAAFSAGKYARLERNRWILLLKNWPASRLLAIAPALAGVELAVLVFAARQGWLKEKLMTYPDLLRLLPGIVADRRRVLSARRTDATDGPLLTGTLQFDGFDHPLLTRVANPILSAYWKLVRRLPGVA